MNYRRGRQALTINLLYDIAEKLGVDPTSLLPDIKNPKTRISFEDHIWHIIEERLDEYIDKKIGEKLKPKK
jgi:transcriptional regulator with XRE-family HTH domain